MRFTIRAFSFASLFFAFALVSCSDDAQDSTAGETESTSGATADMSADAHAQVVHDYFNAVISEDWETIRSLVTEDFVYHTGGEEYNIDETIAMFQMYMDAFDMTGSVKDVVASGDKVAYHVIMSGVNSGPMGDMPATNKEVSAASMGFLRFEGDKVAEEWEIFDEGTMLRQLGILPEMEMPGVDDAGAEADTAAAS